MTAPQSYVVAELGDAKESLAVSYLTRRGQSLDPEKRASGARDWQPALSGAVERFIDREGTTALHAARAAASTWGGTPITYELAIRYESIRSEGWVRLDSAEATYPSMGLGPIEDEFGL